MSMDVSRHESVFNPVAWGRRRVDVIGAGATGSKVALSLAKLGVQNLHVWDEDVVEPHNLANQAYTTEHVGMNKAAATAASIKAHTGASITAYQRFWRGERQLGEVIFMMADSMKARAELLSAVRMNPSVRLVIDSRLGADSAQLYTYTPTNPDDLRAYQGTLFSDEEAHVEVSACGTSISVGPTSDIVSGLAVWRFIRAAAREEVEPVLAVGAKEPFLAAI